jgi:prepilin-type N-terminal cleavage/methylation domain-containing protein
MPHADSLHLNTAAARRPDASDLPEPGAGVRAMRAGCSRRGFTLAEMLIVLVILGIAVSIAVPRMNTATVRLDGAMHEVGAQLMAAQNAAIARQHDVVVAFDEPGRRLRIHYDADNDAVMDAEERVRYAEVPTGVEFGRGSAGALFIGPDAVTYAYRQVGLKAVVFRRNGSASAEGGFYLQPRAAEADGTRPHVRAVAVERGTGRPTWYRYSGGTWLRTD